MQVCRCPIAVRQLLQTHSVHLSRDGACDGRNRSEHGWCCLLQICSCPQAVRECLWDHSVDFLRNAISYPGDEGRNGRHAFLQVCCCPHTVRQMLGQPGILSRNSFKFEAYRISKLNHACLLGNSMMVTEGSCTTVLRNPNTQRLA